MAVDFLRVLTDFLRSSFLGVEQNAENSTYEWPYPVQLFLEGRLLGAQTTEGYINKMRWHGNEISMWSFVSAYGGP